METHEALGQAQVFLAVYSEADFPTQAAFIAAAILWGERLGAERMLNEALWAAADVRDEILGSLTKAST